MGRLYYNCSCHLTDDNSRVKLIPNADLDEGDGSDYINASFMPVTNHCSIREFHTEFFYGHQYYFSQLNVTIITRSVKLFYSIGHIFLLNIIRDTSTLVEMSPTVLLLRCIL